MNDTILLQQLALRWCYGLLYGVKEKIILDPKYLIDDGRKRAKLWNELLDGGYVADGGVLASKAFDEVEPMKPDLLGYLPDETHMRRDTDFWLRYPGVIYERLTLARKKYVVTHPEEYTFFIFNGNWPHDGIKVFAFGESAPPGRGSSMDVWVKDEVFDKHRGAAMYKLDFDRVKNKNLPWALKDQGIIEDVDRDCFSHAGDYEFMRGNGGEYFSHAPDKWEDELVAMIGHCRDKIAFYTRKANVLSAAQRKIEAAGGWEKLHAVFDEKVHEYLKEEHTKKQTDGTGE